MHVELLYSVYDGRKLLFVLCAVIIGNAGRERSYTWPSTHTCYEGGGGIFSASTKEDQSKHKTARYVPSSRV